MSDQREGGGVLMNKSKEEAKEIGSMEDVFTPEDMESMSKFGTTEAWDTIEKRLKENGKNLQTVFAIEVTELVLSGYAQWLVDRRPRAREDILSLYKVLALLPYDNEDRKEEEK